MNSPIITAIPALNVYCLFQAYATEIWLGSKKYNIIVPAGFRTDGASIPRVFWSTTGSPFNPDFSAASLIHDFGYKHGYIYIIEHGKQKFLPLSRKEHDKLFRDNLKIAGVGLYTRNKMYYGVRAGGWKAWNKHRRGK